MYDTNWGAFSANSEESLFKKPSNLFPASSSSTSVPMYDSVHSIKVPLRTYDGKSRAKPMPYHNHRRRETATKRKCPTVAEVTKQMSGLVFDRVEKSVGFPLYKTTHPVPSVQKKGGCLSISPSTRLQVRLDRCNNYTGCHKTLLGYFRQLYVGWMQCRSVLSCMNTICNTYELILLKVQPCSSPFILQIIFYCLQTVLREKTSKWASLQGSSKQVLYFYVQTFVGVSQ